MKKEERIVCRDRKLGVEAYYLGGIVQSFPSHFHDHYVIGFVEKGARRLSCSGVSCDIGEGSIMLFQPGQSHSCNSREDSFFEYRGFNIEKKTMQDFMEDAEGRRRLPAFSGAAVKDRDLLDCLRRSHRRLMEPAGGFEREENLLLALSLLLRRYGRESAKQRAPSCRGEIEKACRFLQEHYPERISLEQICRQADLGKTALIRAFTREKGVTPYRYLQNVRINQAKKLLEKGVPAAEAALETGFSDQSHFTTFFRRFTGLTPGSYGDICVKSKESR